MDLDRRCGLELCLASNHHRFIVSKIFDDGHAELKLLFRKRTVTLDYYDMWKINVNTGVVSTPSIAKRYEAEMAHISGRAGNESAEHDLFFLLIRL